LDYFFASATTEPLLVLQSASVIDITPLPLHAFLKYQHVGEPMMARGAHQCASTADGQAFQK
jgi:hypothetical protein